MKFTKFHTLLAMLTSFLQAVSVDGINCYGGTQKGHGKNVDKSGKSFTNTFANCKLENGLACVCKAEYTRCMSIYTPDSDTLVVDCCIDAVLISNGAMPDVINCKNNMQGSAGEGSDKKIINICDKDLCNGKEKKKDEETTGGEAGLSSLSKNLCLWTASVLALL